MKCKKCGNDININSVACPFCREEILPSVYNHKKRRKNKNIIEQYKYMYLLMLIGQVIGIFIDSTWVIGVVFAGYCLDMQYLKALNVKGNWKIWGIFCTPVYLFIRAKKLKQKNIIAIISIIIVMISLLTAFIPSSSNGKYSNDMIYINSARTLINKSLKNPQSVIYNEEYIYDKDNFGRAIVYLDYSAQNSFGGYVRERKYVFINKINKDGTFSYNPSYYYCTADNDQTNVMIFDVFKKKNNFGEPQNLE